MEIDFAHTHTHKSLMTHAEQHRGWQQSGSRTRKMWNYYYFPRQAKTIRHNQRESLLRASHTSTHSRHEERKNWEKWFFPSRWFHYNTSESRFALVLLSGKFSFHAGKLRENLRKFTDSAFVSLAIMIIWAFRVFPFISAVTAQVLARPCRQDVHPLRIHSNAQILTPPLTQQREKPAHISLIK